MMERLQVPILLPVAALLTVGLVMGGLGVLFSAVGRIGTIAIGMAIVVIVPLVGAYLTRRR